MQSTTQLTMVLVFVGAVLKPFAGGKSGNG